MREPRVPLLILARFRQMRGNEVYSYGMKFRPGLFWFVVTLILAACLFKNMRASRKQKLLLETVQLQVESLNQDLKTTRSQLQELQTASKSSSAGDRSRRGDDAAESASGAGAASESGASEPTTGNR